MLSAVVRSKGLAKKFSDGFEEAQLGGSSCQRKAKPNRELEASQNRLIEVNKL